MKTAARFICIFLLFYIAACVPFSQKTVEPSVTSIPQQSEETALPTLDAGLSVERLQNRVYLSPSFEKPIQLINGAYSEEDLTITLLPQIAIGDLTGDQKNDAAVLLAENSGGTGNFVSLVVIASQDGEYHQVGSQLIDDRPIIQSLGITDGSIILEATIHGINDPMVSPTVEVKQTYKLLENYLTMVRQSSTAQGGTERSIAIESPVNGSDVSGTIQLKGSMPIAPFENNLSFKIVDLDGTDLYNTGFMVTSADLGMPAAFNNEITLPVLPSGAWVRLELAELSMADGSVICMDSILVKIK
ncbi:MAG: hypothetical protein C0410_06920 [Anaerolinea sp.]|nr:hypothetical protein [Anaerolinea sp.]